MAEFFCDQGAYASDLGAAPTWGQPQEGDGSATTPAAAASIGSILFSAVPTSGAISICGATVSTTGVLAAASVAAAANALAANINATTAATTAAAAHGQPQLRNLMFARGPAGGAPAGTCEIMMRVGSNRLNTAVNANAAIASTLNNSPTITQFAGGSGGCWGWFLNTAAALGVSGSIGQRQHGAMANKPLVHPSATGFTADDTINVRTGRNLTLTVGLNTWGALTTRDSYLNFVFDDGTVWVGDSPSSKMTVNWEAYSASVRWVENSQYATYRCRKQGNFRIEHRHTSNYPMTFAVHGSSSSAFGAHIEGIHVIELAGGDSSQMLACEAGIYGGRFEFSLKNCLFDFSAVPRANLPLEFIRFSDNVQRPSIVLTGNEFRWSLTGSGAAAVSVPFARSNTANAIFFWAAQGNVFTTGSSFDLTILTLGGFAPGVGAQVVCENNKGAGFPAGPIGIPSALLHPNSAFLIFDNLAIGGAAKYETRSGYAGFDPGQPTLTSISPDGTPWSWRAFWTTAVNSISPGRPFQLPANRAQSRLATGVRSWSQELLLDAVALAQIQGKATMEVQYVSASGVPVCDRVPVVLASSSAVWSGAGVAPFDTWVARKFSGVTSQSVAIDSMLTFRLCLEAPISGVTTASLLMNPEVSIT